MKIHLLLLIIISTNCLSQNRSNADITDVTKLTFFNPGISYEKRIGKFQSLYAQAFMSTSIGLSYSSSFGFASFIYFDPAMALQYRFYYNPVKRKSKGKRTEMNSLNYVSSIFDLIISKSSRSFASYYEKDRYATTLVGIAWGLQRNYPKRFSLDLSFGAGYLYTKEAEINDSGQFVIKNAGQFTTLVQLNVGFWLNRRN